MNPRIHIIPRFVMFVFASNLAISLAVVVLTACDADQPCTSDAGPALTIAVAPDDSPDALTFREVGPPWQWVIPATMPLAEVLALFNACGITAPMTASVSGYQSDMTNPDNITMGLGASFSGTAKDKVCLLEVFGKSGAYEVKP